MSKTDNDAIDWCLTTWEGSLQEQLRRWSELPLESIVRAQEEMQELAERLVAGAVSPAHRRAHPVTRVMRYGDSTPGIRLWENTTPEERMNAVWELTLQCLAWQGSAAGEPRLQRSVVSIQRPQR